MEKPITASRLSLVMNPNTITARALTNLYLYTRKF